MQTHESPLFTATEAAALTRMSVKAVNNAIDKKTVPATSGQRVGLATRLLDLRALIWNAGWPIAFFPCCDGTSSRR
jgi:hypothetical protein